MSKLQGGCMCGAVRWTSDSAVTRNLSCHCSDCQRATSSPFTTFIGLVPDTVKWTGEITHYESSKGTHRGFCPKCGTRLYFKSESWPGEVHIHAATLDDPNAYIPDAHVVLRSKLPWLHLNDDIPIYQNFEATPEDIIKE